MSSPRPFPVLALTPASCCSVRWYLHGAPRLTVIVKATFTIVNGSPMKPAAPLEIVRRDRPPEPPSSFEEISEAAPYLPSAEVVVRGRASLPRAAAGSSAIEVRLGLFRDGAWVLNKKLDLALDRDRPDPPAKTPIFYERVDFIHGNEWVFLEGMHPRLPSIMSGLPEARALAKMYRSVGASGEHTYPIDIVADTLVIDVDRLTCSVIWRGNEALLPDDTPETVQLFAGVELPGQPIEWPALNEELPTVRKSDFKPRTSPTETAVLRPDVVAALANKPIAPFALAPPSSGSSTRPTSSSSSPSSPSSPNSPSARPIPGAPFGRAERGALPIPGAPFGNATKNPPQPPPKAASVEATITAMLKLDRAATGAADLLRPSKAALPFAPASPPAPRVEPPRDAVPFGLPFALSAAAQSFKTAAPQITDLPDTIDAEPLTEDELLVEPEPKAAQVTTQPTTQAATQAATQATTHPSAPKPPDAPSPSTGPIEPQATGLRKAVLDRLRHGEPLHGLELSGTTLDDVDFSGAALDHCNLSGTNLARCDFTKASLIGADLSAADLTLADLTLADLTGANLSRANLTKARFVRAKLANADLSSAKGSSAVFEGASLKRADMRHARLPEADLKGADLSSVNGSKADLARANLTKANLDAASLRAASLREATLAGAGVDGADLRDANLTRANVHDVDLSRAKTNGAILRELIKSPPDPGAVPE